ncbi:hypothetical protein K438DRAFT_1566862 [Mycena galopus ATCC 62051]|nr:hypothetical protein K438DRAFT_1566862 [Mycena galopus ATCC 62051]
MTLYSKVVEHELALVNAWKNEGGRGLNPENLLATLKSLGFSPEKSRFEKRHAHFSSGGDTTEEQVPLSEEEIPFGDSNEEAVLKERKRPPPVGGYPFPKEDQVVTKLGKLPPGPCRLCGSEKHWNRECPNYVVYSEGMKRNAHLVSVGEPSAEETMYQSAFTVLLNQTLANASSGEGKHSPAAIETSSCRTSENRDKVDLETTDIGLTDTQDYEQRSSSFIGMEEIEDEDEAAWRAMPKSERALLEEVDEIEDEQQTFWINDGKVLPEEDCESSSNEEEDSETTEEREVYTTERRPTAESGSSEIATPTKATSDEPIRLYKRRRAKAGTSALGTSVLSMRGRVGSRDGAIIDLRLDTCADITLISEEFYHSLPKCPPIQEGIHIRLIQLMQEESGIQGFVTIPLFVRTEEGDEIETEAEAYVVPGMSVPILLGEDYQSTYELALTRNVERGTMIHFQDWAYTVRAQNVAQTMAAFSLATKSWTREKKRNCTAEKRIVCAAQDYKLRPHESRSVLLEGHFEEDKEWLVEKNLLTNANDSVFVIANTLISSRHPYVPIANPTDQPRMIRKGEAVGILTDPEGFFDAPKTTDRLEKYK